MAVETKMASAEVKRFSQGYIAPHPSLRKDAVDVEGYLRSHQVYTKEYLASVTPSHHNPRQWFEFLGWYWHVAVRTLVWLVTSALAGAAGAGDASGARRSERLLAQRISFFAAAGQALGAAGAVANHFKSWVRARPGNGWVHTLVAEAECARAHLGVMMSVAKPSLLARLALLGVQVQVFLQYLAVYLLAPGMAHAYSAYRAEEQVFNYSEALRLLERGLLRGWAGLPAPDLARAYYALEGGASLHDAMLRMRADEACIHHVNTVFAHLQPCDRNPFISMGGRGKEW